MLWFVVHCFIDGLVHSYYVAPLPRPTQTPHATPHCTAEPAGRRWSPGFLREPED